MRFHISKNRIVKTWIFIIMLVTASTGAIPVQAFDDFYSDSEIQFIDPNACDPNLDEGTEDNPDDTAPGTGRWSLAAGANRPGADLTANFKLFLDELAKHTSNEPVITTGTNHSQYSSSGNVSDHWAGNGADFGAAANKFGTSSAQPGQDVPRGDEIAAAALIAAGMDSSTAKKKAKQGGAINHNGKLDGKPIRVQVIWKSDVGGNHHDHVHVGIRSLSSGYKTKPADKKLAAAPKEKTIVESIAAYVTPTAGAAAAEEDAHELPGSTTASVFVLGDSITFGAREELKSEFEKANLDAIISARESRTLSKPGKEGDSFGTPNSYHSGLAQVTVSSSKIKSSSAAVVALGTNPENNENIFKDKVKDTVEKIKSIKPRMKVYWVEIFSDVSHKNDYNGILRALSKDGEFFTVIPAANASIKRDSDGVHPTPEGSTTFAKVIADKVQLSGVGKPEVAKADIPESSCCPTPDTSSPVISASDEIVEGSSAAQQVFNYLKRQGATNAGAAGIVGNLMQESGGGTYNLNPKIDNGTHRGIAQWAKADRWKNLVTHANKMSGSPSPDSIKAQRSFLWEELTKMSQLLATIKTTSDAKKAATDFEAIFERSGGSELNKRIEYAEKALRDFGGESPADGEAAANDTQICVCEDPSASGDVSGANPANLKAFIEKYADAALAAGKKEGVPYDAMLAQIAHESGIPLSELASKYNNFGGIKFTGTGKSTPPMATTEAGQGRVMARFRAFDTAEEGIQYQAKFFTENSRYSKALNYPRNPQRFIQEVAKAGYATDPIYAQKVIAKLKEVQQVLTSLGKPLSKDVQPDNPPGGGDKSDEETEPSVLGCTGGDAAGKVLDGFAFPVGKLKKNEVGANSKLPCTNPSGCHHDGTAAFDLGKAGSNGVLGNLSKGLPVYAIEDGTITNYRTTYRGIATCPSYQLKGASGWMYWYGHTQSRKLKEGKKVKAGEEIAVIGPSKCTGAGPTNPPHLHIDRGKPKGSPGGSLGSRDTSINEVINKTWEALP